MHLCFAIHDGQAEYHFAMLSLCSKQTKLSMHYYLWSFVCVAFHVVTWLLSSIVRILSFMPMFRVLSSQLAMLLQSRLCWLHVTSKIIFVITYLLEDEQELSLGMLIRCKRIYNFYAPCLFYTNWFMFCLHFVTFFCISGTNLLTRCHSASSYFLLFFYSRLLLKEIFSELDKIKAKVPIFLTRSRSPKGRRSRATRWPHLVVARAPLAILPHGGGPWYVKMYL
jgi:hypothetical protein